MKEYRIKELNGEFTIQAAYLSKINLGSWWRRKVVTEVSWSPITFRGQPIYAYDYRRRHHFKPLNSFKTKEQAKTHIDKHILHTKPLEEGIDTPIYHEVKI